MTDKNYINTIIKKLESMSDEEIQARSYKGLSLSEKQLLPTLTLNFYEGKVRQMLKKNDTAYMIHTDKLSAFDKHITCIPYKGPILSNISAYWFEYIRNEVPHHFLEIQHDRVLKVKQAQPISLEIIVRGYMAGNLQRAYLDGKREYCGNILPENLKKSQKLPHPIITPTLKAAAYEHDLDTNKDEILFNKICSKDQLEKIYNYAFILFEIGSKRLAEIGWLLVDTKFEFGITKDGEVILIDELLTPDSSRLWQKSSYESNFQSGQDPVMFDKEIIRKYLISKGFSGEGNPPKIPKNLIISLLQKYSNIAEALYQTPLKVTEFTDNLVHSLIAKL